jgi:predicted CXXCH cytochrome family protein
MIMIFRQKQQQHKPAWLDKFSRPQQTMESPISAWKACRQSRLSDKGYIPAGLLFLFYLLLLIPATGQGAASGTAYPDKKETLTTEECMQCHPDIATLLRTAGAMHSHVECRQCHLEFHTFIAGKTNYEDILPKCARCHEHPHGEELLQCSSCHQEAHSPLYIPASRALSQGCYVCHPGPDKDIKTFSTRHTDLYCTACHHTKHGNIPECLECHKKHTETLPAPGKMTQSSAPLDQCLSCHPPHKALKVAYPDDTPNAVCGYCHRKAREMLEQSNTKHTALLCIKCHPDQHKTIKRCIECHGTPHPEQMLKKFNSCGGCHGVAHSLVK